MGARLMSRPTGRSQPRCPRCGYDLRGVIESWIELCPMTGRCSECGLEFVWSEVLHPEKYEPQWCVEFVGRWRQLLRAGAATWFRSFFPRRFFSTLKMSMRIRWWRLTLYAGALMLPLLFGYTAIQTIVAVRVRDSIQQQIDRGRTGSQQALTSYLTDRKTWVDQFKQVAERSVTRAREQASIAAADGSWYVVPSRVVDIEAFGPDAWANRRLDAEIQRLQTVLNAPTSIDPPALSAWAEAVFTPFKSTSSGSVVRPWRRRPRTAYPPPRELHLVFFDDVLDRNSARLDYDAALVTLTAVALGVWMWLLFPLMFLLLPISMRRARVRWGHVLRVTCYGLFIPSLVISSVLLTASVGYALDDLSDTMFGFGHFVGRFLAVPMLVIWWAMAIKYYLRIPHSWAVVVLLTAILFFLYLAVLRSTFLEFLLSRFW